MRTKVRKLTSVLLAVIMAFSLFTIAPITASAATSGDFVYRVLIDGTVEIHGYSGSAEVLEIPSEIGGYRVKSIGEGAFLNSTSLVSVTIPDSVIYICCQAFSGCTSLESVSIPDSVTGIDSWAFEDCTSLKSITIPRSVTEINYEVVGLIWNEELMEYEIIDGFKIYGYKGTEAERYANKYGITFVSLDDAPTPILGDANGDGEVNVLDVSTIQLYVAKMTAPEIVTEACDVDGDGDINVNDVSLLQMKIAKLIP